MPQPSEVEMRCSLTEFMSESQWTHHCDTVTFIPDCWFNLLNHNLFMIEFIFLLLSLHYYSCSNEKFLISSSPDNQISGLCYLSLHEWLQAELAQPESGQAILSGLEITASDLQSKSHSHHCKPGDVWLCTCGAEKQQEASTQWPGDWHAKQWHLAGGRRERKRDNISLCSSVSPLVSSSSISQYVAMILYIYNLWWLHPSPN